MDNDVSMYVKKGSRYINVEELYGELVCIEAEKHTLLMDNIMLRESLLTLSKELAKALKQPKTKTKKKEQ